MTSKKSFTIGFLALVSLTCSRCLLAQATPTAQELIDAAHKAVDLSPLGPYVLKASLVINPGTIDQRNGKLTVSRDRDRARVEMELGGQNEVRFFQKNSEYIIPDQLFLSVTGLSQFDRLWDPARRNEFAIGGGYTLGSVSQQTINGQSAWCLDKKLEHSALTVCFDQARTLVFSEGFSKASKTEFLDYAVIGDRMFPRTVKAFRKYAPPIEVTNITINSSPLSDEVFKIPENAVEIESCERKEPPKAKYTPEPTFPQSAPKSMTYVAVLSVLITKEGKVAGTRALTSDQYGFSKSAQDSVRTWRFKPSTCNGRPVATEMNIEAAFQRF